MKKTEQKPFNSEPLSLVAKQLGMGTSKAISILNECHKDRKYTENTILSESEIEELQAQIIKDVLESRKSLEEEYIDCMIPRSTRSISSIRIHNAIVFAAKALNGHFLKNSDIPSIVHSMEVMQILSENECEENVIIAGILHDVLECTAVKPKDIVSNFGKDILEMLQIDWEDRSKPWPERKQVVIKNLSQASFQFQLYFCAQKLANLKNIYAEKLIIGDIIYDYLEAPKDQIKWFCKEIDLAMNKIDNYPMKKEFIWFTKVLFS